MKLTRAVALVALPLLAAATPSPVLKRGGGGTTTITVTATPTATTISECNAGAAQCCNSVQSASSGGLASILLGLLGIVLEGVDANVGLDCSPISVIGVGGGTCNSNAVCCENNNVGGLISIGCAPIIL